MYVYLSNTTVGIAKLVPRNIISNLLLKGKSKMKKKGSWDVYQSYITKTLLPQKNHLTNIFALLKIHSNILLIHWRLAANETETETKAENENENETKNRIIGYGG